MKKDDVSGSEVKYIKPILKWAGGKTQLLNELLPRVPKKYNSYIEPFFGGGALFFALQPERAIIADSNPELINVYQQVACNVEGVVSALKQHLNTKDHFQEVREQDWESLAPEVAAARTIFLNRTCFNGLYRVNKCGVFNTPYGGYKNPVICNEKALHAASDALKGKAIICGDYLEVLQRYAQEGDFVFLDPPYLPVSKYSDFKRYTKEQFHEEDHVELAKMVVRLHERGCFVLLTNSNHPQVQELYAPFIIDVVKTKRSISCKGNTRGGEDVIVTAPYIVKKPVQRCLIRPSFEPLNAQTSLYPPTRFMGSKSKLLTEIWKVASRFETDIVVDLFSGSGIVGYMFKAQGKTVISNDYMHMATSFATALIENQLVTIPHAEAEYLLQPHGKVDDFVSSTFKGVYFSDEDNYVIDVLRTNIRDIKNRYKHAIAMSALMRACIKKRPRGVFTYTGLKFNDGRMDLIKSFPQHFLEGVELINRAVFDNGKLCRAINGNALDLRLEEAELVYIDPPYFSPLSDNEYVRRYHFVEGLARDWQGVEIQEHTLTKKFKSYPTPFSSQRGAVEAFESLFKYYANAVIIVSYSSNSLPTQEELSALIKKYKQNVEVVPIDYKYSFGNRKDSKVDRNSVKEYLFIGY